MKGGGIENPAFETPDPVLGRQRYTGPARAGAGDAGPAEPGPGLCLEEGSCGWGPCSPRALQVCNNPEGYLAAYSLLAIFQGIVVNGLVNISISTIEKRYELNSSLTGLISASYDIAFCVLSLFVSYFGERGHKPRWLAFSAFMLGLGSLVFSLPHFSSGKYQYGRKIEDTCQTAETTFANATCSVSANSSLHKYLYVFILGQLLLGVGGTPLYTLGTAFIDDSVPKHMSSLYIGTAKIQAEKISETHDDGSQVLVQANNIGQSFKDFPMALMILLRNPVLMSLIIASSSEALVATGFATFLPKFIENQFGKSSSFSATLGGTIPGPILFGVAIDSSCTLWDINECETKGACWVYDNERMAFSLMGIKKDKSDEDPLPPDRKKKTSVPKDEDDLRDRLRESLLLNSSSLEVYTISERLSP
ncbi:hypothetical protein DUI87_04999 [Hirundo rustica rustica]|uniref:Major facilitator superfamily (MFS) profile domain-containing protein n=1 Tax=Hirundo rustica rustica TaxID=333673 RepID=A0A3M0L561_HIRRU|nr:hypothetical protein DUI87_04999 [Hirundo rustica rustica]